MAQPLKSKLNAKAAAFVPQQSRPLKPDWELVRDKPSTPLGKATVEIIGPVLAVCRGMFARPIYRRKIMLENTWVFDGPSCLLSCESCYLSYHCCYHTRSFYRFSDYELATVPDLSRDILLIILRMILDKENKILLQWRRVNYTWKSFIDSLPEYKQRMKVAKKRHKERARVNLEQMVIHIRWSTNHISNLAEYFELYREIRQMLPSYCCGVIWERELGECYRNPAAQQRLHKTFYRYSHVETVCEKLKKIKTKALALLANEISDDEESVCPPSPKYYRRFYSCCGLSDSDSEYETDESEWKPGGVKYIRSGSYGKYTYEPVRKGQSY